ncbi:hypothetical protein GALMADRAFT_140546 [Galerina marginata CBS 339.88]|uniref:DUF6535 domain-containing protein n=1 Tax=Galerina marginata (strain CBS 339.88) TaxID=685588 RepID=A0A067SY78_GALM3|nr:hypothetical protein GALMADRAFT_140546 [Galerina marginata CBS 339.88]
MFPRNTNVKLSLIVLRLLILSSIAWVATVWQESSVHDAETFCSIAVTGLILIHCMLGACFLRHPNVNEALDLLITLAETLAFGYLNRTLFKHVTSIPPWASQLYIFYVAMFFTQVCALGLIIGLHIYSLQRGFREQPTICDAKPWAIILGGFLFESRDALYISRRIQIFRGVSGAALLLLLLVVTFFAMIILPVHERGLVPVKEYRTDDLLTDNPGMEPPILNIMAVMNLGSHAARDVELFKAAVNVTPLWNEGAVAPFIPQIPWHNDDPTDSPFKPPCEHVEGNTTFNDLSHNVPSLPYIQTIKIFCPSRYAQNSSAHGKFTLPSSWTFPDIQITIDFSILGISPADALIDARYKTVSIVVGLAAADEDVFSTTTPIPIYTESYMLGSIGFSLRRKYLRPSWATLASVLVSQRTFFVCDLQTLMPDPSSVIVRRNNTGMLRLYGQDDNSEWYVRGDHREHDVFGGLGISGGFWASINGLFVVLFGSSLLWVISGSKPLSIFGVFNGGETTKKILVSSFPRKGHNPHRESSRIEDLDFDALIWQRLRESVNCGPFENPYARYRSPGSSLPTAGYAFVGGNGSRSSDELRLALYPPSGTVFEPITIATLAAGYAQLGDDKRRSNDIELVDRPALALATAAELTRPGCAPAIAPSSTYGAFQFSESVELRPIITQLSSLKDGNSFKLGGTTPQTPFLDIQGPTQISDAEYDNIGLEASENALVWNVYNEESSKIDAATTEASNRGIDVLLVFTGLFSAVLTTFIIQSYQLMIPNPLDTTNNLLTQYLSAQNISNEIGTSSLADAAPSLNQLRWVNGLWFAALSCSLSAALFSMLAKQWLQAAPNVSGSPRHRARQRQRRYLQMRNWHVMTVINALPLLLHATLLLFFAGLIVLLWSGNRAITVATCVIVAFVFLFYFGSIWLSMMDPDCPYQHPISEQLRRWRIWRKNRRSVEVQEDLEGGFQQLPNPWTEEEPDYIPEKINVDDFVDASALVWLIEKSPNETAKATGLQAIAGLPRNFTAFRVLRDAGAISLVLKEFRACFHRDSTLDTQWYVLMPNIAEKYCRAWMRLTCETSKNWPPDLLGHLKALQGLQELNNVSAIAACTRAVAFLDAKDGRSMVLSYLARYTEGHVDFSHEMQCWLLDTFLQCSLISQLRFPRVFIAKEAVPVLIRLLHHTKHTLASNVRSAVALSLSYMTGGNVDPTLFNDEEKRRDQFYELIIPSLAIIVDRPADFSVNVELLDLVTMEFSRIAALALLPTSVNRRHLRSIAQRGLTKLYLDGRTKHLSNNVLESVLQILYPPAPDMLARKEHPLFVTLLLQALWSSSDLRTMVGSVLRLLEPIFSNAHPAVVDTFIEGKGIAILLRAALTGDTGSRRLQLDCMRNLCLFIGTVAHYSLLDASSVHPPNSLNHDHLDHIFHSEFFSTLNMIVTAHRWWLPEINEIWVPALVKLCQLRPQEPVWIGVEATFRKFAEDNEGKDGAHRLLNDLDHMKVLINNPAFTISSM